MLSPLSSPILQSTEQCVQYFNDGYLLLTCITYTLIVHMSTTCLLQVLGSVLGAECSVCSRGYAAQDFFMCVKKNRRMKDAVWFSLSKFTT